MPKALSTRRTLPLIPSWSWKALACFFCQRAHDLEALDCCISGFHHLEASRWFDQALQLAVIRLETVFMYFT